MGNSLPANNIQPVSRFCCHHLDPTNDSRWAEFVERHPRASVFHTVGWLEALRRTYGYEPVAYTTSSPTGDLNVVLYRYRFQIIANLFATQPKT
jgi:hypothetical protein